ncbi:MAG: AhpC/TSA family protein [Chitinophagales bacterium]|nr:AhpC/TSA family protein [Chitinophagales bacterium]
MSIYYFKPKDFLLIPFLFIITGFAKGQNLQFFKASSVKPAKDTVSRSSEFYISGTIKGKENGSFVLRSEQKVLDTFPIINGKFVISGRCDYPELIFFKIIGDYYLYSFFVEHGDIKIFLDLDTHKFTAQGSRENDMKNHFNDMTESIITKLSEYYSKIDTAKSLADFDMYLKYSDSCLLVEKEFIQKLEKQIKERVYGYYLLSSINAALISYAYFDERKTLLDRLPDSIKNSPMGKEAYRYLNEDKASQEELAEKRKAYIFNLKDSSGKEYSLAQYKAKYILIDFWASWCVPCLKELPLLKKIYSIIKADDVIFISISVDRNRDDWIKALSKYEIPWLSLLSDKETVDKYRISSIPNKILISPGGDIIGSGLSISDVYSKLKDREF